MGGSVEQIESGSLLMMARAGLIRTGEVFHEELSQTQVTGRDDLRIASTVCSIEPENIWCQAWNGLSNVNPLWPIKHRLHLSKE